MSLYKNEMDKKEDMGKMKKNILIGLEGLGIGGVETVVLNHVKVFIKKGHNVIVIAKNGIYKQQIEDLGAKVIEFEFKIQDHIEIEKLELIKGVMENEKITEVHIHQLPLINHFMYGCVKLNIPYVAYLHFDLGTMKDDNNNVCNWFEKVYANFKSDFKEYLENANRIVAITDTTKQYISKRYAIDEKKIKVVLNAIDLGKYKSKNKIKKIQNILIISRFSEEKSESIFKSIDMYVELKKHLPNIHLNLVGDGNTKEKILEYVKAKVNKENFTYYGAINNVIEVMEQNDIVIALGRCIIEAMTLKRIAIISSTNGRQIKVTPENFKECAEANFSGETNNDSSMEKVVDEIVGKKFSTLKMQNRKIYNLIKKKLNVFKNVVECNCKNFRYDEKFYDSIVEEVDKYKK